MLAMAISRALSPASRAPVGGMNTGRIGLAGLRAYCTDKKNARQKIEWRAFGKCRFSKESAEPGREERLDHATMQSPVATRLRRSRLNASSRIT